MTNKLFYFLLLQSVYLIDYIEKGILIGFMSLDAETTNFLILMDKYLDDEVVIDGYISKSF